jgi:predicted nucleic acid-binding protein
VTFVLDASVALAWCFEDERSPPLVALLGRATTEGAYAPQIWPLEVLNALLSAQRRGRIDSAKRRELASLLRQLPVTLDPDTATEAWSATQALAEAHRLTAYDAAYLELALRLALPLASMDTALVAAAASLGAPLLVVS